MAPDDPDTEDAGRPYLRIQPADEPLDRTAVCQQFQRLHSLDGTADQGLLPRLLPWSGTPPTIEVLLASTGDTDPAVEYYVGVDAEGDQPLDTLERTLRGLFPDTYEFERTRWHPQSLLDPDAGTCGEDTDSGADPDAHVAATEFRGVAERRRDWQTQLTPIEEFGDAEGPADAPPIPLATVAETMAETPVPMVYQCLLRRKAEWSGAAADRQQRLRYGKDTMAARIVSGFLTELGATEIDEGPPDREVLAPSDRQRLESIEARDVRRSFVVNARAVAATDTAPGAVDRAIDEIATAFTPVSGLVHEIDGATHHGGSDAHALRTAVLDRTFRPQSYETLRSRLPLTTNASAGIVADSTEASGFCLVDGAALTAAAGRAVGPTPGERMARPQPPTDLLDPYDTDGFSLGRPLTQDGNVTDTTVAVPTELQPLHTGIYGPTGSGKSVLAATALLDTHEVTDGATIVVEPKGDGMVTDYLTAHYERHGSLEDVYYFDCSDHLPAFSFFDVRPLLKAGVPRDTAVEKLTSHYMEILRQVVGRDRFESAIRSPDVIQYLVKALFDPANGTDTYGHRDLHAAVRRMHERESPPTVSQPDLERALNGIVANRSRTFDEIMQGVANRIEKLLVDRRLARVFNHVPEDDTDPHFDFREYLDEDVTIIFDLGDLQGDAQRVLTLVVLSKLWTACKRRTQQADADSHPLVNLHVEEAASVAVSELLNTLLAQGRAFDLAVSLSLQFPAQLKERAPDTYRELLANVGSFVVGPVPVDDELAKRLATDDMPPAAVANRLRALERGEWLVSLPGAFGDPAPRAFRVQSLAPPPGHSASDDAIPTTRKELAEAAITRARARTQNEAGLSLGTPGVADSHGTDGDHGSTDDADSDDDADAPRVDSLLPHTNRLPRCVEYDDALHGLRCRACDNRYDPGIDGMKRAIACCHGREEVDRDDVPVCDVNLKLTPAERGASDWTDAQLLFLQAVYNAQQRRYDRMEYDMTRDSMLRLREYVDVDADAVEDLIDVGLLQHDTDHPHKLYSVTPDGRDVIGESYREGVDYGHGKGDLEESSEHVLGVQLGEQLLEQEYVASDDSPAAEVVPYYEREDTQRLDIAALDEDGDVVVAVEVERINHDVQRAVPDDFDKMAACDPREAIWIVMGRAAGHDVVQALNDPPEGDPRVEKTYSENTPPHQFHIDTDGLTAVCPIQYVQSTLLDGGQ